MLIPRAVWAEEPRGAATPPDAPESKPADPRPGDPELAPTAPDAPKIKVYAPGVRINWSLPAVEVDAVVAMQQGQLELLACSPQTREHESILVIPARPRHIFEAMGLVGLSPGAPTAYDAEKKEWRPPHGERLRLDIRYDEKGRERTVPAEEWLLDAARGRPAEPLDWVFAGSVFGKDGEFGADAEGTIVCVVDFSTALIAVGSLHTSDDAELWLAANPQRVPERGTRCTLVIRGREGRHIAVEISREGAILHEGRPVTAKAVAALYQERVEGGQRPSVVVRRGEGAETRALQDAVRAIQEAGVPAEAIKVAPDAKPPPERKPQG